MADLTPRQHVPDPQQVIGDLLDDLRGGDESMAYLDAIGTLGDLRHDDLIEVCIQLGRRLLECEAARPAT